MGGIPGAGDRPDVAEPPGVTSLCVVRIEQFPSGQVLVTVSTCGDVATGELTVAGRSSSGLAALPLLTDFLRRYGEPEVR